MALSENSVIVNGIKINLLEKPGSGLGMLMVHGNSSSAQAFRGVLESPSMDGIRCLAIDLPGHGASDSLESHALPALVDHLVAIARTLGMESSVLVGHSLGGHLLMDALPKLPNTRGLCVFGAPPLSKPPRLDLAFLPNPAASTLFKSTVSDEELQALKVACLYQGSVGPGFESDFRRARPKVREELGQSLMALELQDEIGILKSLRFPVAILHGERDALINPQFYAKAELPMPWRGEVQIVQGSAHYPHAENPQAVAALLSAYYADLSAQK